MFGTRWPRPILMDQTHSSQLYELKGRVIQTKQSGGPRVEYYSALQRTWAKIDRHRPNLMETPEDIVILNAMTQEDRAYTFLYGLDDRMDSEILRMKPLPMMPEAYAIVRKEDNQYSVMCRGHGSSTNFVAMISKGGQKSSKGNITLEGCKGEIAHSTKRKGCTYCGNPRHTKDACFKLHGYQIGGKIRQACKQKDGTRGAKNIMALTTLEPNGWINISLKKDCHTKAIIGHGTKRQIPFE